MQCDLYTCLSLCDRSAYSKCNIDGEGCSDKEQAFIEQIGEGFHRPGFRRDLQAELATMIAGKTNPEDEWVVQRIAILQQFDKEARAEL